MRQECLNVQQALEEGRKMPYALIRQLSRVQLGPVPEELKAEIMAQADTRTLTRWLIAAAGSDSVEAFAEKIGEK